jgi:hypothetical protein
MLNRISDNLGGVNGLRATNGTHSEKSAISLSMKLPFQPRLARNRLSSGRSVRSMHLYGLEIAIMITSSDSSMNWSGTFASLTQSEDWAAKAAADVEWHCMQFSSHESDPYTARGSHTPSTTIRYSTNIRHPRQNLATLQIPMCSTNTGRYRSVTKSEQENICVATHTVLLCIVRCISEQDSPGGRRVLSPVINPDRCFHLEV